MQDLSRQLADATKLVELTRDEHLCAAAAARDAAVAGTTRLQAQLEQESKDAAVQKVLAEGWQRDAKVGA
jgi:hypothetical protein